MGILWIFECLHYILHGDHDSINCNSYAEFLFQIIGCINLLRGCLIFFIFVCKDSIREKVCPRNHQIFNFPCADKPFVFLWHKSVISVQNMMLLSVGTDIAGVLVAKVCRHDDMICIHGGIFAEWTLDLLWVKRDEMRKGSLSAVYLLV